MRILILCTGNSCRSQMAEGFVKKLRPDWEVYSAGTNPSDKVHPNAIDVMQEKGIDLNPYKPKTVDLFLHLPFDYVITVCDHARETCPVFMGAIREQIHIGFEDPAEATGTEEEIYAVFRRIRDEIQQEFTSFVNRVS